MDESSCALWLQEVESVDYWGPTFRAIYEGGAQEEFLQRLEKRIEEHDSEIEKMCNHHYQVNNLDASKLCSCSGRTIPVGSNSLIKLIV